MHMKCLAPGKCSKEVNFSHSQMSLDYQEPYKKSDIQEKDGKTMVRMCDKHEGFRKLYVVNLQ